MAQPGTLSVDAADVEQGTFLHFTYSVSADHVSAKNWVGLYPSGTAPGDTSSTVWTYAPGAGGTVSINSGAAPPGSYDGWYLYDDGYTPIADPVPITVREAVQLPAPRYVGQFGRRLGGPAGMTRDARGDFWVADPPTRSVHHYDRSGRLVRIIGDDVLSDPQDVAVVGGTAYVADAGRNSVEVFTSRGRHRGSIGRGAVVRPRGIEAHDGQLLVSDVGGNRVARFDLATGRASGAITTDIHIPHGIVSDGAKVWVVSSSRQYDGNNGITSYAGDVPQITLGYGQHSTFGSLSNPAHVAVGTGGMVLVTVPDFGFVSRFHPTGAFAGEFGTEGKGLLRYPQGVVAGPDGLVFVADTGHSRIAIFREQA